MSEPWMSDDERAAASLPAIVLGVPVRWHAASGPVRRGATGWGPPLHVRVLDGARVGSERVWLVTATVVETRIAAQGWGPTLAEAVHRAHADLCERAGVAVAWAASEVAL